MSALGKAKTAARPERTSKSQVAAPYLYKLWSVRDNSATARDAAVVICRAKQMRRRVRETRMQTHKQAKRAACEKTPPAKTATHPDDNTQQQCWWTHLCHHRAPAQARLGVPPQER